MAGSRRPRSGARLPPDPSRSRRRARERRFWTRAFRSDPTFLGGDPSPFAQWSAARVEGLVRPGRLVELGAGTGRDTRFWAGRGFTVRGVDLAGRPRGEIEEGGRHRGAGGWSIHTGDALRFLRRQPSGSARVVYSNMFFNMDFTEAEHRFLFGEVRRVLAPNGWHLYSVRATSDPWYGRGIPQGPDTFRFEPPGVTLHFFSRAYAKTLRRAGFRCVRSVERPDGGEEFPVRLLYFVDRSRGGPGPRRSSA